MGDAPGMLTLRELADLVREFVGEAGATLQHTVDVIVVEICRCWPERAMADIAKDVATTTSGDAVLDAIAVVTAKVRENIEARWGCKPSHKAALDLVLRACVIQFSQLWFSCPEARINMRAVIAMVRQGKATI